MVNAEASLTPLGWREQKKLKTRRALKDAALDLALERGMDSLTVEAISEAAEVSPRTFFNYFACKEDALVAEAGAAAAQLHDLIIERPVDEPPLRVLRTVISHSDFFSPAYVDRERILARQKLVVEHPPLMSRQLAQYAHVERTFSDALAIRLGVDPQQDPRPDLLAAITVSVLRTVMRRWSTDGKQPLYEQIDAAFAGLEREDLNAPARLPA